MKKIIVLAGMILAGSSNVVLAQKQMPPEGGAPRNFTLPARQEFALDNGLQATLVPFGDIPKVTVYAVVQVGNVHEQPAENGLADIVGQLMREGTTSLNATQLSEQVARMGGSLDVSVGPNQTILSGAVLSEYGPELVRLMASLLQEPAFPQSEIGRVKNDFKRSLNVARARPGTQAQTKYRMALYKGHPYGYDLPSDEQISKYDVDQVRDFYQRQFGAQRTRVYVAGKFQAPAMQQAISEAFKPWQKGPAPQIPLAQASTQASLLLLDRPGAPQSTIVIGLPVVDPSHPDYTRLRVMNSLLGGSFGSRITRNIREDKGYTYSPYSNINARYRVADWSEVADVTTEHTGNSLREIIKEIGLLQKAAPAAAELKGIQNYEAGLFVLRNSTPAGIIGQLNFLDLHGLPDSYLAKQVEEIHAVTPQQVQETAKKYLRSEDMTLVVVGDKKVIAPQIKKIEAELKKTL
jgi:zinc protease